MNNLVEIGIFFENLEIQEILLEVSDDGSSQSYEGIINWEDVETSNYISINLKLIEEKKRSWNQEVLVCELVDFWLEGENYVNDKMNFIQKEELAKELFKNKIKILNSEIER